MIPEPVRSKLWREGVDKQVYVILDGAQNENLLDVMAEFDGLESRCLLKGKLEPDMQEVAPYLVHLVEDAPFTVWLMDNGWAQNWGIFLVSQGDIDDVWRHLRGHTRVLDPNRVRLYFRFYDPRVLNAFLPTCDTQQLGSFFGLVDLFLAEREGGQGALVHSLADGQLVSEAVGEV